MLKRLLGGVRGLMPVFWVAVAVTLAGTVTGSVIDRVHRVNAEQQAAKAVKAEAQGDKQVLKISQWGVQAVLPLAAEMSLLSFDSESPDAVGLTSADLAKLGVNCLANHNALGSILRYPAGSYGTTIKVTVGSNMVATVGGYDFVYQFPSNSCTDTNAGMSIVNREMPVVLDSLGTLAPVQ